MSYEHYKCRGIDIVAEVVYGLRLCCLELLHFAVNTTEGGGYLFLSNLFIVYCSCVSEYSERCRECLVIYCIVSCSILNLMNYGMCLSYGGKVSMWENSRYLTACALLFLFLFYLLYFLCIFINYIWSRNTRAMQNWLAYDCNRASQNLLHFQFILSCCYLGWQLCCTPSYLTTHLVFSVDSCVFIIAIV